ncbi:MAG TPA: hypothetical protein VF970_05465 [Gemmatimonadales bacterium]
MVHAPELLPSLRLLFPAYEVAPAPGSAVAISVKRSDGGWRVGVKGAPPHGCATVIEVAEAVEFSLTHAFLRLNQEAVQVHASGAVFRGGAMLLLGGEGSGKTSLAFWLSRTGHRVLADDVTIVAPGGRALAFKRLFKVDPAVLADAGVPVESTRLWEPAATTAWYDPDEGGGWADEARVTSVAILRREARGMARARSVSRAAALNALLHSLLATGAARAAAFEVLAQAVREAVTFELHFPGAAAAVKVLETILP